MCHPDCPVGGPGGSGRVVGTTVDSCARRLLPNEWPTARCAAIQRSLRGRYALTERGSSRSGDGGRIVRTPSLRSVTIGRNGRPIPGPLPRIVATPRSHLLL